MCSFCCKCRGKPCKEWSVCPMIKIIENLTFSSIQLLGSRAWNYICLDLCRLGDLDFRLGDLDRCLLGGERLRRRSISFKFSLAFYFISTKRMNWYILRYYLIVILKIYSLKYFYNYIDLSASQGWHIAKNTAPYNYLCSTFRDKI